MFKKNSIFNEDIPPDRFLDFNHYTRYALVRDLIEEKKVKLTGRDEVQDCGYQYFLQGFETDYSNFRRGVIIIGTDDSGKYFSTITQGDMPKYRGLQFRQYYFGFDYHYFQINEAYAYMDNAQSVRIRLQGDLVVRMRYLKFMNMRTLFGEVGIKRFIVEKALKENDMFSYYLARTDIPNALLRLAEKYVEDPADVGTVIKLLSELRYEKRRLRIVWSTGSNPHVIHARGVVSSDRRFVVNPPHIVVYHPEHEKVVFPIKEPIFMTIGE